MTPRPRLTPDHLVIQAAAQVLARVGTENLRLTDVAAESGLAAATLVQRFGSRDGLLAAIGSSFVTTVTDIFRVTAPTQLDRLQKALCALDAATHMLFFCARPAQGPAYSLELRKQIAFALSASVERGELPPCGVADIARRVQLGFYGLVCAALLETVPVSEESIRALISQSLADV